MWAAIEHDLNGKKHATIFTLMVLAAGCGEPASSNPSPHDTSPTQACPNAGTTECLNGQSRTCELDGIGNLKWTQWQACAWGECADAGSCLVCEDACQADALRCVDNHEANGQGATLQHCADGADGCHQWIVDENCESGQCADASTCFVCDHKCDPDAVACVEETVDGATRAVVKACQADGQGCRDWVEVQTCATNVCASDSQCLICDQECDQGEESCTADIEGNAVAQTCGVDANGCRAWVAAETCESGLCADDTVCCEHACEAGSSQVVSVKDEGEILVQFQTCVAAANQCRGWETTDVVKFLTYEELEFTDKPGESPQCDSESDLGRLRVANNVGDLEPAVNLCVQTEWFGDVDYHNKFKMIEKTNFDVPVISLWAGGFVVVHDNKVVDWVLATVENRNDGHAALTVFSEGGYSGGGITLDAALEIPGQEMKANIRRTADGWSLVTKTANEIILELPMFELDPADHWLEVDDVLALIDEYGGDDAKTYVRYLGGIGDKADLETQEKILDALKAWHEAEDGRSSAFYDALGNMGSTLTVGLAVDLLGADDWEQVAYGVTVLRRVEGESVRTHLVDAIFKAYPHSLGWGSSRNRHAEEVVRVALNAIGEPEPELYAQFQELLDAHEEENSDMRYYLWYWRSDD